MGVYDEEIEMATEMIDEFGQSVTWRQVANGTPADPAKDWKPGPSVNVDNPVKIAFFPVDREQQRFVQYMSKMEVSVGGLLGYMAQVDFTPTLKDVVIRGGVEYTVDNLDVIDPNGEGVILYILEFGT